MAVTTKLRRQKSETVDNIAAHDELVAHVREAILKCICTEKLVIKDNKEVFIKSRLVKLVNGEMFAKCKKCGKWIMVPLEIL